MLQKDEKVNFIKNLIEKNHDYRYIINRFYEEFGEEIGIEHIYNVYREIALEHYLNGRQTKAIENPLFPKLCFVFRYLPASEILQEITDEMKRWKILHCTDYLREKTLLLVFNREELSGVINLTESPVSIFIQRDVLIVALKRTLLSFYLPSLSKTFEAKLGREIKSIQRDTIEYEGEVFQGFQIEEDGRIKFHGLIDRTHGEAESKEPKSDESIAQTKEDNKQTEESAPFLLIATLSAGKQFNLNLHCYFTAKNPNSGYQIETLKTDLSSPQIELMQSTVRALSENENVRNVLRYYLSPPKNLSGIEELIVRLEYFLKFIVSQHRLVFHFNNKKMTVFILEQPFLDLSKIHSYSGLLLVKSLTSHLFMSKPIFSFEITEGKINQIEIDEEVSTNSLSLPSIRRDEFLKPKVELNLESKKNLLISSSSELLFYGKGFTFFFLEKKAKLIKHRFPNPAYYQSVFEIESDKLYAVLFLNKEEIKIFGLEVSEIPKFKELIILKQTDEEMIIGDIYVFDKEHFRNLFLAKEQYLVPNLFEKVLSYRISDSVIFFFTELENIVSFSLDGKYLGKICEAESIYQFKELPISLRNSLFFIDEHLVAIFENGTRVSGSKGFEKHINTCLGGEVETQYREELLGKYSISFNEFVNKYLKGEEA